MLVTATMGGEEAPISRGSAAGAGFARAESEAPGDCSQAGVAAESRWQCTLLDRAAWLAVSTRVDTPSKLTGEAPGEVYLCQGEFGKSQMICISVCLRSFNVPARVPRLQQGASRLDSQSNVAASL